ncbi:hypothetical protein H0H93_015251 [Arthromyces matolae]|nr:hypothetical protein H0H93_015251 [Arthromyces matolae]
MAAPLSEAALQKLREPRGRSTSSHFTLSVPDSENSSREASPAPSLKRNGYPASLRNLDNKINEDLTPGRLPTDVYEATLPRWRAMIRRSLVRSVRWESKVIARLQSLIRTPWLDAYFVYTSSLGTHTFFMILLPAFFFFGHNVMGRGHVHRLASTPASTLSSEPVLSTQIYTLVTILLSIYTFSIVFGRIYTAMHSFTDCAVGVALGSLIWWVESSWQGIPIVLTSSNPLYWLYNLVWPGYDLHILHLGRGLGGGQWVEEWVRRGGWEVPIILIPLCLLAVNQHPQPVDDCPCFEDAIAFGSVVLGALVGAWAMSYFGLRMDIAKAVVMPGSGWLREAGQWVQVDRTIWDVVMWWGFATLKMVVGILVIFVWRILAKSILHVILPPTFRGVARIFSLPNRRFYTPATDYTSVPSEFSGNGLHPIPSVIDLPSSAGVGIEVGGIGSGVRSALNSGSNEIKLRSSGSGEKEQLNPAPVLIPELEQGGKDKDVKHYDAEVLTKVVVYAGIAILAAEVLPATFEVLGWGVHSSPGAAPHTSQPELAGQVTVMIKFSSLFATLLLASSVCLGAPSLQKRDAGPTFHRCGVSISEERRTSAEKSFKSSRVATGDTTAKAKIDVHFHVVMANNTYEGGNVPQSQIEDQMTVLNKDYGKSGISFNLANVTRIISKDWFEKVGPDSTENTALKSVFRMGNESTLNIYTVGFVHIDTPGLLGYATFPFDYKSNPLDDGVVIRYSSLPKGSAAPFNEGRTASHEIGHWFGLYHTFENGCDGPGDFVDDTAPEKTAASGCPVGRHTCPGGPPDPIRNFMDYTDDKCMTGFTDGQVARMRAQLWTYRLLSSD